ncbi:low molecular weight phosphatase family protein [Streptomyces sp. MZ04]|uniref:arsenate reductase/protein-tyrosine-phosphatase family protein n=1 Tax=Streptomyces sp. MZ04 TaxID=2559236 RepID=UPI00107E72EF|nr:low molecular weight phosphatase family protein [Streptomyces sp. MZ04]TGA92457.1 low molecular weight phosphatase family protein [Streptomyces sp. MZ04]
MTRRPATEPGLSPSAGSSDGPTDPRATFTVLFVCTGNTYRSPLAERLLAARLGPGTGVRVASAGTEAPWGDTMDPATRSVLMGLGGDAEGFRPRLLTAELVAGASLVLGLERRHREAAVRLVPVALRRCFTLKEFVRLAEGDAGPGQGIDVVARAVARRGTVCAPRPADDDIDDPSGEPYDVLRSCGQDIDAVAVRLAALLSAERGPAVPL